MRRLLILLAVLGPVQLAASPRDDRAREIEHLAQMRLADVTTPLQSRLYLDDCALTLMGFYDRVFDGRLDVYVVQTSLTVARVRPIMIDQLSSFVDDDTLGRMGLISFDLPEFTPITPHTDVAYTDTAADILSRPQGDPTIGASWTFFLNDPVSAQQIEDLAQKLQDYKQDYCALAS